MDFLANPIHPLPTPKAYQTQRGELAYGLVKWGAKWMSLKIFPQPVVRGLGKG